MNRHAEQFVGAIFRILRNKGYGEAQQQLIESYRSQAHSDREELVSNLTTELVTVLRQHLTRQEEVDVLTATVEYLVDRFVTIIEVTPVAIVVVDRDGTIQLWNRGAERTFGWAESDVLGESYRELLSETPDTLESLFARLEDGEQLPGVETQHRHSDGAILDVRLWAAPLSHDGSEFAGATFAVSDVTAQKQREQRLAVLNRVLRHNVRNDVTVIRGHLELLADAVPEDNAHVETIDERLTNVVELSETAHRIEELQTGDGTDLTTYDLRSLVRDRLDRLRTGWPDAEIRETVPESVPVVAHRLLPYALDNLLENAIEHNDSRSPRVFVDAAAKSQSRSDYVTLTIGDDGPGLPDNEKKVLTSETETPLRHSTGTGLWLTRWTIRSSGGRFAVESNRFDGTRVRVELRQSREA